MRAKVTPFGLQSAVQTPFISAMTAPVILSAAGEQSSEGHVSRVNRLLHPGWGGGWAGVPLRRRRRREEAA